jgi:hypothetical protein
MTLMVLRWSVALALGAGGASLIVSLAHTGRPSLLIALGAAELVAAVLFAVPQTSRIGGLALLGALAAAAVIHAAAGQPPPIGFVVDAAAIWVVLSDGARARAGAR